MAFLYLIDTCLYHLLNTYARISHNCRRVRAAFREHYPCYMGALRAIIDDKATYLVFRHTQQLNKICSKLKINIKITYKEILNQLIIISL